MLVKEYYNQWVSNWAPSLSTMSKLSSFVSSLTLSRSTLIGWLTCSKPPATPSSRKEADSTWSTKQWRWAMLRNKKKKWAKEDSKSGKGRWKGWAHSWRSPNTRDTRQHRAIHWVDEKENIRNRNLECEKANDSVHGRFSKSGKSKILEKI